MHVNGDTLIVVDYVDGLVLTRNKPNIIFRLKSPPTGTFEMIDLGILNLFLGIQVLPLLNGLFISRSNYVLDLLKRFKMDNYKACAMPFQLRVNWLSIVSLLRSMQPCIISWLVSLFIILIVNQTIALLLVWYLASCESLEKVIGRIPSA